jgi:hypothetical protein
MPAGKTEAQFAIVIIVIEPYDIIVQSRPSALFRVGSESPRIMNFDYIEPTANIETIDLFGLIL